MSPEYIIDDSSSSTPPRQGVDDDDTQRLSVSAQVATTLQKVINQFDKKMKVLEDKISEETTRIDKAENKIERTKSQNIETLGLFVALFTFISVDFSVIKTATSYNAVVSITFILAGFLIFFILLLHLITLGLRKIGLRMGFFNFVIFSLALGSIYVGLNFNNIHPNDYPINLPAPAVSPSASPSISPSPISKRK